MSGIREALHHDERCMHVYGDMEPAMHGVRLSYLQVHR